MLKGRSLGWRRDPPFGEPFVDARCSLGRYEEGNDLAAVSAYDLVCRCVYDLMCRSVFGES